MNNPSKLGDRYLCFEVLRRGMGWRGAYGQTWSGPVWGCVECGYQIHEGTGGLSPNGYIAIEKAPAGTNTAYMELKIESRKAGSNG